MSAYVQSRHMKAAEKTMQSIKLVQANLKTAIDDKRAPESDSDFLKKLAGVVKASLDLVKTST
eukprot:8464298-Pyramimonas_sp.AAC.1